MGNSYSKMIKDLRTEKGFSQSSIADRLGMSRPSYVSIEQGKRELTFGEAEKVSSIFGISLDQIENRVVPNYEK